MFELLLQIYVLKKFCLSDKELDPAPNNNSLKGLSLHSS